MLSQTVKIDVSSYPALIWVTLPAIFAVVLEPMAEMVDTAILGHADMAYLGGLAATNACLGSFAWIFNFLSHGVTAQIAQSIGAGRRRQLGTQIRTALAFALAIGLGFGLGLFCMGDFLLQQVLGASGELLELSRSYYAIRVLAFPLTILSISLLGILRGLQQIRLTMWIVLAMTLLNATGSYIAVFYFGLGMEGAAIATVASFVLGVLIPLGWLYRCRKELGLDGVWQLEWHDVRSLGNDGLNMAGRSGLLTLSFFLLTACASRLGTEVVAAQQVALQLWLLASFCIDGLAITATSLGGQFVGAGDGRSLAILSKRLLRLALGLGSCFLALYILAEPFLVGLFTNQEALFPLLRTLWLWLALTQPLNALAYVFDGLLFGHRAFGFLRQRMLEGVVFVFLPLLAVGFWYSQSLLGLWTAHFALNAYRLFSGWWGCRRFALGDARLK
jgi:putative MATE family efflux protein